MTRTRIRTRQEPLVTASPRTLRNFVTGASVEPEGEVTSDIVSPVTAQVVAKAPVSTAAEVDRAYGAAAAAFEVWGDATPSQRQQALLKFADAVELRADEFVHLEAENTGKPYALTASEELPAMVSITGSVRAGMQVAESAAHDVKRVHLELGGKAPVVLFDDADLEAAVEGIGMAGYFNAGQDCTAATRVIAGPGIHDDFVAALAQYARSSVKVGLPDDEDAALGPVNNVNQLAHVEGFLSRLPDHASISAGGSRVTGLGDGYFYTPTVLSGLRQDDEAIQREIFGPVITVQKFSDEAQALAWANGVEYGLASSVWTKDFGRAMRMSRRMNFGCVWINTHIPIVAEMPHGGFKHSGYGKDLSMYGFEDYTRIKHVMANIDG